MLEQQHFDSIFLLLSAVIASVFQNTDTVICRSLSKIQNTIRAKKIYPNLQYNSRSARLQKRTL